ncbi:MAG: hypothetical protein QG593_366 [Patescibacteria group bacterium]|nr:hypothetical protein [Patescibacteria group bacterium]
MAQWLIITPVIAILGYAIYKMVSGIIYYLTYSPKERVDNWIQNTKNDYWSVNSISNEVHCVQSFPDSSVKETTIETKRKFYLVRFFLILLALGFLYLLYLLLPFLERF